MRVLGIDYGTVRIGVAVSDEDGERAAPVRTIPRADDAAAARLIVDEAKQHDAAQVVLGLPLKLDGTEGDAARRARALGRKLETAGLKVVYWDERLTTAAAERVLKEQGLDAVKRREVVDQVAATMLLQSWLDARAAQAVQHAPKERWRSETDDAAEPAPSRRDPPRGRDARRPKRSAG